MHRDVAANLRRRSKQLEEIVMRALIFLSLRLRSLLVVAIFALAAPSVAWSAVAFSNGSNAVLTGDLMTGTLDGVFFQSAPFQLNTSVSNLAAGTATWFDPIGDEIHLRFAVDDSAFDNPFLQTFTGTFDIIGGTGKFLDSVGGGDFKAFVFYSAPGIVAKVTAINSGEIRLIPEPAIWVMLAAGLGLLGFVRLRRAAHNGI
jgi:hypothetical protein